MPVTPVVRKLRQEDHSEFHTKLSYTEVPGQPIPFNRIKPCLKIP